MAVIIVGTVTISITGVLTGPHTRLILSFCGFSVVEALRLGERTVVDTRQSFVEEKMVEVLVIVDDVDEGPVVRPAPVGEFVVLELYGVTTGLLISERGRLIPIPTETLSRRLRIGDPLVLVRTHFGVNLWCIDTDQPDGVFGPVLVLDIYRVAVNDSTVTVLSLSLESLVPSPVESDELSDSSSVPPSLVPKIDRTP